MNNYINFPFKFLPVFYGLLRLLPANKRYTSIAVFNNTKFLVFPPLGGQIFL